MKKRAPVSGSKAQAGRGRSAGTVKPRKPSTKKRALPNSSPRRRQPNWKAKAVQKTKALQHQMTLSASDSSLPASTSGLPRWIDENQLDHFVRAHAEKAQRVIVELIARLVAASVPNARTRRIPLPDSINQPGPDGYLETDDGYSSFVPSGVSYWEIGAGVSPREKATADYAERTKATPAKTRKASTFVFVTPLSGRRSDFQGTWKPEQLFSWRQKRRAERKWRDVVVIDGTQLVAWLHQLPAVERWLAQQVSTAEIKQTTTPDLEWQDIRAVGGPPQLTPDLFLVGRRAAQEQLEQVLRREVTELRVETHTPVDMIRFIAAHVASLQDQERIKLVGRCLMVLHPDAWPAAVAIHDPHVLVAAFDQNEQEAGDTMLLERARARGHVVVFAQPPGGLQHANGIQLPSPREHEIQDALEKAGYPRERARTASQRSGGNLSSLFRLLQKASLQPEWASTTSAHALVIAELLGQWHDAQDKDREVAETLAGRPYRDWIADIRSVAALRDSPLTHRNGVWKMVPRYEAWHVLSRRVFDEHLERFKTIAIEVLSERDPRFELAADERYLAGVKGKVLRNSHQLRKGIAETLALLGADGSALKSCTSGRPSIVAALVIRELLLAKDWVAWASLDRLLPLLAEAAPDEFLAAVEHALEQGACPFDDLFSQEGHGLGQGTYTSGLLWALETLAWDPDHLTRVTVCLGRLHARDPGGQWVNRPINSLSTIYAAWLRETTASVERKKTALVALIKEAPAQAWDLLTALIPRGHGVSMGSHRPCWRSWIPQDRSDDITAAEYTEHIAFYTERLVDLALTDSDRLQKLLAQLHRLPKDAFERVVSYLDSNAVLEIDEEQRTPIWNALQEFVWRQRKYAGARWALKAADVDRVADIVTKVAPTSRFLQCRRLFTERGDVEFFDEITDRSTQFQLAEKRRSDTAVELYRGSGIERILQFASEVSSPNRLGFALGASELGPELDAVLLPDRVTATNPATVQFLTGYVRARFFNAGPSWLDGTWLDGLQLETWMFTDRLKLLSWLPFFPSVWARVPELLQDREAEYWRTVPVEPYTANQGVELAARKLLEHGRAFAAIRCLEAELSVRETVDADLLLDALLAAAGEELETPLPEGYSLARLIEHLQVNGADRAKLARVEWGYLPLLDRHFGPGPRTLEEDLSTNPLFFCHLLTLVFRSENERGTPKEEVTEQRRNMGQNAFRLLCEWRRIPGLRDGGIDEELFNRWIDAALERCRETGHTELGQQHIGHVLAFSPAAPNGDWPPDVVAECLDRPRLSKMRRGMTTQLFNNRGVHVFDGGAGERALAARYHAQADAIEARGYHRLATSIRELGDRYVMDAEKAAARGWDE